MQIGAAERQQLSIRVEAIAVLEREHPADRRRSRPHRAGSTPSQSAGCRRNRRVSAPANRTAAAPAERRRGRARRALRGRRSMWPRYRARQPQARPVCPGSSIFPATRTINAATPSASATPMRLADVLEDVREPRPEPALAATKSKQLRYQRARQDERDAALEANQHGLGHEVDDHACARGPGRNAEHADESPRAHAERDVTSLVAE